jgi:flagellar basal body P-ring formation protein FlgA
VEKGALVTMIVQTPFMTLSTQGRALDEGAMGDTIRVMNARSRKVVEAQVTKSDTVMIQTAVLNLE